MSYCYCSYLSACACSSLCLACTRPPRTPVPAPIPVSLHQPLYCSCLCVPVMCLCSYLRPCLCVHRYLGNAFSCGCRRSPKRRSPTPPTTLHVMNLTRNVLREHLVEIFSNYGRVANVELLIDRRTGISKCSAFVEFTNKGEVEKAKEYMDGVRFSSLYISLPISLSSLSVCVCV